MHGTHNVKVENDLKKIGVRGWEKIAREREGLGIDPEAGQSPAGTVEPVEK